MVNAFTETLDEVRESCCERIENVAKDYRERVLIPLCKKHRLTFVSGMGSFCFWRGNTWISEEEEARRLGLDDVADALETLYHEALARYDCFGFYVADITKTDLK